MTEYLFGCKLNENKPWVEEWPFNKLGAAIAVEPEVALPFPYQLREFMKQKRANCTASALTWITMINNMPKPIREKNPKSYKFDVEWMYDDARLNDGDPSNDRIDDPSCDIGTYIWAVMTTLMTKGHRQLSGGKFLEPNLKWKIKSFYWCKTVLEMESAIAIRRPIEFGFPIPENLFDITEKDGELWVGEKRPWKSIVAGHALCCRRYTRKLEAFEVLHTYGLDFPLKTLISYRSVEELMGMAGEACVCIDDDTLMG